ncbi:MAG: serine/threonine protein kinase [Planctomycetes bacterium]|nr:serine/threonine protein kinase [Planctomycetota bacterium]
MATPTLGELALKARLIRGSELDDALRYQRQGYLEGDFRRLGELLVAYGYASRPSVRRLLQSQRIMIVECVLCQTRYNAIDFRGRAECLRCGRALQPSRPGASLVVEDCISCSAQGRALLQEIRQRNPRLGRYEILGEVGRGGMGVIYKASEPRLKRNVALKFMHPDAGMSEEDQERFRREAQAVASLRHPHIVQALAIEESRGLTYMAMDFVAGVSMEVLTNQGALSPEEIVGVTIRVAEGLEHAHQHGVIHRDVKPANIVIDRSLKPSLVDFGVAKVNDQSNVSLTSEGEVLGSLAYMAPEYISKGRTALDARCDVYGLGVVLYESLTQGLLPYGDPDDEDMIARLVHDAPIPLLQAHPVAPTGLAKIVDRMISKDPDKRHQSAAEVARDLESWLRTGQGIPPPAKDVFARTTGEMEAFVLDEDEDERAPRAGAGGGLLPYYVLSIGSVFLAIACGFGWASSSARADRDAGVLRARLGMAELRAARALDASGDLRGALSSMDEALKILANTLDPPKHADLLRERAALRDRSGDAGGAAEDRAQAEQLSR